ncbi:ABC transporter substrate-binding protein [Nonomuraea harbinensis]|uniref:ABC transporter substrate-binding protein n=1 Tax=Nonomuraea harbinensis TaxID=1286938 RepID=A0ABW1BM85_9ACTN|nr:ABC transporter substrate-binding protein [Nonomuraea harbinensis]
MRARSRLLTFLLALAVLAAGCGGPAGSERKDGSVLRFGVFGGTESLDPYLTIQTVAAMLYPAYDTLTVMNEKFEVEPWLATEWSRPDDRTWRLKLRDDVTFHDGSAFDAETVKLNFERGKTLESSPYIALYSAMDEVKVVDPHTVDVVFGRPYPSFPTEMASISGAMVSPKAIKEKTDLTRTVAGSGGWIFEASTYDPKARIAYAANRDYWAKDLVKVDRLEYSIIADDSARFNAYQGGQLDVLGHLQPGQIQTAKGGGAAILETPIECNAIIVTDRVGKMVPALKDERVRRAIGLLIDRQAMNAAAYSGGGNPEVGGFMPPASTWHNTALDGVYKTPDVAQAKRLLAEAGHPDGFSFEIATVDLVKQRLSALAQMLAAGGIEMKLVTVPPNSLAKGNREGKFPVITVTSRHVVPASWYSAYISKAGPYNAAFGAEDMADLDELAAKADAAGDEAESKRIWDEIQKEVLDRGFMFPMMWTSQRAAVSAKVTGDVVLRPGESTPRPHGLSVAA